MNQRILIVDDEPNVRLSYRAALETEGYAVEEVDSAALALEALSARHFDLAILDMRMPEMDGLDLLAAMRERTLSTPAVIITAYGDLPHAVRAVKLGAIDFLQKPLLPDQLRHIVAEIVTRHATKPDDTVSQDYHFHLRAAKRAINRRNFDSAIRSLKEALSHNDRSAEGFNLAGVLAELRADFANARRYYEQAIRINGDFAPARQNAHRLDQLSQLGTSNAPIALHDDKL
jgi:DNA-binding NtrC family response regulator